MTHGYHLKHISFLAASIFFGFGVAMAACPEGETEIGSEPGQFFLKAETEIYVNEDYVKAGEFLTQAQALDLNCAEHAIGLKLRAAVHLKREEYKQAALLLKEVLDNALGPEDELQKLRWNLAQIYLQTDDYKSAKQYMLEWVARGGKLDRDRNWQLAVVHQLADDNMGAIPYAEAVLKADGRGAKREVYDFLIYLYDHTDQLVKKAKLLEILLERDPSDKRIWEVIASDYYRANNERKAFEVTKAMYLNGLLTSENEIMRVVNFYNQFNAPYEAAKVLEKELNAGRIESKFAKYELLANLYQAAREHDKAIPIIRRAAELGKAGQMYERLGRSYLELKEYAKAEEALLDAINAGGIKQPGAAWMYIGQARYERDNRSGARDAFRNATRFSDGRRGGRSWLSFMNSEDQTKEERRKFNIRVQIEEKRNIALQCKLMADVDPTKVGPECTTIRDEIGNLEAQL